jgi:hypothetical protein
VHTYFMFYYAILHICTCIYSIIISFWHIWSILHVYRMTRCGYILLKLPIVSFITCLFYHCHFYFANTCYSILLYSIILVFNIILPYVVVFVCIFGIWLWYYTYVYIICCFNSYVTILLYYVVLFVVVLCCITLLYTYIL